MIRMEFSTTGSIAAKALSSPADGKAQLAIGERNAATASAAGVGISETNRAAVFSAPHRVRLSLSTLPTVPKESAYA